MKRRPRKGTFFGEVGFALLTSLILAAVASTLSHVVPVDIVWRTVIAGLGFVLVLRAVTRSDETTGRIVALGVWLVAAVSIWLAGVALPAYIAVHLMLVWLARSLFGYSSLIEAVLDLGLCWLAICVATLAAMRTGSLLLAAWSFLLVLAFAVVIPATAARLKSGRRTEAQDDSPNRGFEEALAAADAAVQRLAARR